MGDDKLDDTVQLQKKEDVIENVLNDELRLYLPYEGTPHNWHQTGQVWKW